MTVTELISVLEQLPPDSFVYVPVEDGDNIMHEEPVVLGLSYEHEGKEYNIVSIFAECQHFYDENNEDNHTQTSDGQEEDSQMDGKAG